MISGNLGISSHEIRVVICFDRKSSVSSESVVNMITKKVKRPPGPLTLDAPIFRVNDLPWSKVIHLAIRWRQNAHHATRGPVDVPLLTLLDDEVGFAWAAEEEVAVAKLGVEGVVGGGPAVFRDPFAVVRVDADVGVRGCAEAMGWIQTRRG